MVVDNVELRHKGTFAVVWTGEDVFGIPAEQKPTFFDAGYVFIAARNHALFSKYMEHYTDPHTGKEWELKGFVKDPVIWELTRRLMDLAYRGVPFEWPPKNDEKS